VPDVKAMGAIPDKFSGDRQKAENFLEDVLGYLRLNTDVMGYNSPMKRVAFTLTLIEGPDVAGWKHGMGAWIDRMDPTIHNIPAVWTDFLQEFQQQFTDMQSRHHARQALEDLHMRDGAVDQYIAKFEELARNAGYTTGNEETMFLFLKGLPARLLKDVMTPPVLVRYQAIKDRTISAIGAQQIVQQLLQKRGGFVPCTNFQPHPSF
jgi:hypothetical protein